MAYSKPPAELAKAIQNSSNKYGVPVDILTGVWLKESGGNFPNNYVNSSGYGGLFGTTHWNTSTQDQADYSASILAHWYSVYGTWSSALYKYSGGGYTSVPGQTTAGGANKAGSSGTQPQQPSSSSTNPLDIAGAITNLANTIGNIPTTINNDLPSIGAGIGFGILGVWIIIVGTIIIALAALNKTADQPILKAVRG